MFLATVILLLSCIENTSSSSTVQICSVFSSIKHEHDGSVVRTDYKLVQFQLQQLYGEIVQLQSALNDDYNNVQEKSNMYHISEPILRRFFFQNVCYNLVPRAFSSFKMAVGETPGQGCRSGSKSSLEFLHANTMQCLRFVWTTVSDCRKQTGSPDTGNNVRKSHFIMCHVTKYSTIRGVFQQPWPGVSPTAILNEEKALGTRLRVLLCSLSSSFHWFIQLCNETLQHFARFWRLFRSVMWSILVPLKFLFSFFPFFLIFFFLIVVKFLIKQLFYSGFLDIKWL